MVELKLKVVVTSQNNENNPFYGKTSSKQVVEHSICAENDKREDIARYGVKATIKIDHRTLDIEVNRHYLDLVDENNYIAFFEIGNEVFELYTTIRGADIEDIILTQWTSYGEFEEGTDGDKVYHKEDFISVEKLT